MNEDRIRRQQVLREAEGYLELVTVLSDRWALRPSVRDPLVRRVLNALSSLDGHNEDGELLYLKGQALRVQQRYAEAVPPLQDALLQENDNIHVHLALGWCYKRIDRLDLAIEVLEQAITVDPTQPIIYYNLACYWALTENVRLTVDYLAETFAIDSEYRELVAAEPDFDPIRNHPEFQAIAGVIV